jgi:uncharacterized membrane protein YhaH (DUF805 family)
MGLWAAVASCFGKYTTFRGRAPRSEYWYFQLFYMITLIGAAVLDGALGTPRTPGGTTGTLVVVVYWAFFLPLLSVFVRRLHDTDRSGWWFWISLTIIGIIPLLVWLCTKGTTGANRFGTDPLPTLVRGAAEPRRPSVATPDKVEQLTKLRQLLDNGAITQEEFERLKAELLT